MIPLKYTKIIATLGPASSDPDVIRRLIRAGTNCFRLNFSHGAGASMQALIERIREAARLENTYIPILADVQGPKLRIGELPEEGVELRENETFVITNRTVPGSEREVHSPYEYLTTDVRAGMKVLLSDGLIELLAEEVNDQDVICRVVVGGRLYARRGINLPGARLSIEALTDKDREDLQYIANSDIDMVAISFVRSAHDLSRARALLGNSKIPVMAKLERPEALLDLDAILEYSDGIMIARGDLGVEIDFYKIPILQKEILKKASLRGKWAVVATQMLESMIERARPTRAEVTDVANAILDGTDAIMLSGETAVGRYPVKAVEAMSQVARETENLENTSAPDEGRHFADDMVSFAVGAAGAAVSASLRLDARAIVALAGSGLTALLLSKWRPHLPVIALSGDQPTLRRLNVLRGVTPLHIPENSEMETQIRAADALLLENEWARPGDTVVIVAAFPLGQKKETNTIRFHKVRRY